MQGPLILPVCRLGASLVPFVVGETTPSIFASHGLITGTLVQLMSLPCKALLGWIVVAGPSVVAIALVLAPLLRGVPKVSVCVFTNAVLS